MLTGLGAFPLTPLRDDAVDERAFSRLVERVAAAGVDSITTLGSTGSAPYLDRGERARVAAAAVRCAGPVPVVVGISSLRTSQVLALVEDAQKAGASALLLAPMSYHPLTDDDVLAIYEDVTAAVSVPLVVYDNPATTRIALTDELLAAIAMLPNVSSIKIPGVPEGAGPAADRVRRLRALVPAHVTIGVSGDASAARGLIAGCDAWYSVIAGTLPEPALAITRAVQSGDHDAARRESLRLQPLWDLFAAHGGSYRVIAAVAEHLGLAEADCLPRPIRGLGASARARVAAVVAALDLDACAG